MAAITFGVSRPGEYVTSSGYEVDGDALYWEVSRTFDFWLSPCSIADAHLYVSFLVVVNAETNKTEV